MFNKLYTKSMSMIMMLHFKDNFQGCKQILDAPWPKIQVNVRTLRCK